MWGQFAVVVLRARDHWALRIEVAADGKWLQRQLYLRRSMPGLLQGFGHDDRDHLPHVGNGLMR